MHDVLRLEVCQIDRNKLGSRFTLFLTVRASQHDNCSKSNLDLMSNFTVFQSRVDETLLSSYSLLGHKCASFVFLHVGDIKQRVFPEERQQGDHLSVFRNANWFIINLLTDHLWWIKWYTHHFCIVKLKCDINIFASNFIFTMIFDMTFIYMNKYSIYE